MTEPKKSPGETLVQERLAERQAALERDRERQKAERARDPRALVPSPIGVDLAAVLEEARETWAKNQVERAEALGITLAELEVHQERQRASLDRVAAMNGAGSDLEPDDLEALVRGELRDEEPLRAVQGWFRGPGVRPILILCGAVGVGKTLAASWAIAEGGGGKLVHAPELGRRVFPYGHETTIARLELTSAVMVLDDLGTEPDPNEKRWAEALALFVEKRKARGRTIITTNLTPSELRVRYNARILDRLKARAFVVVLESQKSLRAGGGGL